MKKKTLIAFSIIILAALGIALLTTMPESTANTTPTPSGPTSTPAPAFPMDMAVFETENYLLHMLVPAEYAVRQTEAENELIFEILPSEDNFDTTAETFFDQPIVMVYGSILQVSTDQATPDNLAEMHAATFFGTESRFGYTIIGDPVIDNNAPGIIYIYTQAEATLPSGIHTNWMLGSALTNETIVFFAVGLPDSAMDEYGQMAMDMFNSVEIDTELAAELTE